MDGKINHAIVEMKNIVMEIDGVKVVNNANFTAKRGRVCTLLGENYSGKSSLMKILSGLYCYDTGTILLEKKEVLFHTIADAQKLGIRMVYDGNNLMNDFTVIENILLGDSQNLFGKIFTDNKKQKDAVQEMLDFFNINLDLYTKARYLNNLHKKIIEIIRAVIYKPKVIILDEIMENCTTNEQEVLFGMIEKLKQLDIAVIYITKNIKEAIQVSDKIFIMNRGCMVEEIDKESTKLFNAENIVKKMIGESYERRYQKTETKKGSIVLEARCSNGISINVYMGEVVGITGLNGAEKAELIYKIAGMHKSCDWDVYLEGNSIKGDINSEIIRKKIIYFDCDLNQKLIFNDNSEEYLRKSRDFSFVGEYFGNWMSFKNTISPKSKLNPYEGILKKESLLKWNDSEVELLIFEEPTNILNSEAKIEFHEIVNMFLQSGKGVLIVTDDIAELNGFCNRIYKFKNGSVLGELVGDRWNINRMIDIPGL